MKSKMCVFLVSFYNVIQWVLISSVQTVSYNVFNVTEVTTALQLMTFLGPSQHFCKGE